MPEEIEKSLEYLSRAVAFYDKVEASSLDERIAVGRDHHNWLNEATRMCVKAYREHMSQ